MSMTSPVPWLSDHAYSRLPLAERALHWARKHSRVREATGRNDGFWVSTFLKVAGLAGRHPWCGAYVYYCLKQAGFKGGPKYPASTYWWWQWAKDEGKLFQSPSKVKRGDLFVWNSKNGGHIGFILRVNPDGSFQTLEGNTNKKGSREGDGVYDKVRTVSLLKKYPRWGFIRV